MGCTDSPEADSAEEAADDQMGGQLSDDQMDPQLVCGDGLCHPSEDAILCPQDCAYCGDLSCNGDEDDLSCPADCSDQARAMEGGTEDLGPPGGQTQGGVSYQDSGVPPSGGSDEVNEHPCGDQLCDMSESTATCPADCAPDGPQPDPNENLLGWVDNLQVRDGEWVVRGWACHRGWLPSIAVDLYVGGDTSTGTFLRRVIAQEEQEVGVDNACNIVDGRHRFHIPFTEEELSEYAGQSVHVYAVSPVGNENQALNQSGDFSLPDALSDGRLPDELSQVRWLHTDVSNWPVTTTLSVTLGGGRICMEYDKKDVWPSVEIRHTSGERNIDVVANPWVFLEYQGQWYAGTWEWLVVGATCKNQSSVAGDHIKKPEFIPLDWRPTSGQRLYIMVSALARFPQIANIQERSQIVEIIWP